MDKGRDYPKINAKKDIRIRPKSQANFRHRTDPKVAECNGAPRDGCSKGYAIWCGDPGSGRPTAPAKRSACAVITVPCPHRAPWCAAVPHRRAPLRQGAMLGGAPRWGAGGTGRRALRGYRGRTETPPAKLSACATWQAAHRADGAAARAGRPGGQASRPTAKPHERAHDHGTRAVRTTTGSQPGTAVRTTIAPSCLPSIVPSG